MHLVHYDIRDFKWVVETNTFHADGWDLYAAEPPYIGSFPSGRKQFVIKNYQTGNFRRFTHVRDIYDPSGEIWEFESEEGIKCHIYLDIPVD